MISGTGESVQGFNLFVYCFNNPVNLSDESGNWPKWAKKLVAAVAVVAVVATVAAITVATAGAGTALATVAIGAAKGAAIGLAVGAASGATIGYIKTGTLDGTLDGMSDGALSGSICGAISGGISSGIDYKLVMSSTENGLNSFGQLKKAVGSPGASNEWHHIVEQSQISKSSFSNQMIQNPNNIVSISKTSHRKISGYYSSVQEFSHGMTVRNWLAGQSYYSQYKFGLKVIRMFRKG